MRRMPLLPLITFAVSIAAAEYVEAQEAHRMYVGALFGVSTLSGDARSVTTPSSAEASMYKPENGVALNLFAGAHLARYVTLQANYVFNRNDVTLFASSTSPGAFYEQPRESSQHALVADFLLYFRNRQSGIRPYLGTGLAVVRFRSPAATGGLSHGIAPPTGDIESTKVALRSHVGIDFKLGRRWSFRYSFSETISGNPISPHLLPMGERGLANFQNLFGLLRQF
jgi:outer membrane protein W